MEQPREKQQTGDTIWGEKRDNDPKRLVQLMQDVRDKYKTRPDRYQSIHDRQDKSDLTVDCIKLDYYGRYFMTHKGCPILKCPNDLVVFKEMFWDIQPKTIIQLGTFTGGTAIWMADTLNTFSIKAHVYSMDIDQSVITPHTRSIMPDNVTFLQGDSNAIEKTFTNDFLTNLSHPWIVIEDAHVNIHGIMEYFHGYMEQGDYFIVEDLNPDLPNDVYGRIFPDRPYVRTGKVGLEILKKFLTEYNEYYRVDSFYTDFFGYNSTWHWNGYIRKMK